MPPLVALLLLVLALLLARAPLRAAALLLIVAPLLPPGAPASIHTSTLRRLLLAPTSQMDIGRCTHGRVICTCDRGQCTRRRTVFCAACIIGNLVWDKFVVESPAMRGASIRADRRWQAMHARRSAQPGHPLSIVVAAVQDAALQRRL